MIWVTSAIVFGCLAALLAIAWLVCKPLPAETARDVDGPIEELAALHSRRLPQLRQSLDPADASYVQRRLCPAKERQWRRERRKIVRDFIEGLAEDFARIDRLARTVASLSPALSRRQEIERIGLSLRFRVGYRIVCVRLALGELESRRQITALAELIGNMAAQTEAAMAQLQEASDRRAGANFGA
ncbi:MAG: hypothetical protein ACRD4S_07450 [Candidatus Acidiferrales bacterium]